MTVGCPSGWPSAKRDIGRTGKLHSDYWKLNFFRVLSTFLITPDLLIGVQNRSKAYSVTHISKMGGKIHTRLYFCESKLFLILSEFNIVIEFLILLRISFRQVPKKKFSNKIASRPLSENWTFVFVLPLSNLNIQKTTHEITPISRNL